MQNFQDFFETRKRSLISAFSVCMTVPLKVFLFKVNNRSTRERGEIYSELTIKASERRH